MSIPNHIIDQLNSQADLVGIIGRHTQLKKAGNEFKGCCPFHGEKTPSFYVNPTKNLYHCFGCGVSGNPIGFLKDYENLTFMEAVHELSRQTGIDIPEDDRQVTRYRRGRQSPPAPPSVQKHKQTVQKHKQIQAPAQPQTQAQIHSSAQPPNADLPSLAQWSQPPPDHPYHDLPPYHDGSLTDTMPVDMPANWYGFDGTYVHDAYDTQVIQPTSPAIQQPDGDLYELLQRVHEFYQHQLHQHPTAQRYFSSRGLTQETITTFGLGYAPSGWQHLSQAFPYDIEGLKILGLIRQSDGGREYDLLRERVIFAIRNNQGRIIGFAGRALDNDVKPKYINSSDSPVFHKQHVLYGYYESRQQKASRWLVVEGYMDVIALYQAGIYGAVASMGTATNEQQIQRLLKFDDTLTLCFDGDAAGQKAAWRTLQVSLPILQDDQTLRFLTLPQGHDPDSYVKAFGKDAMVEQIDQATMLSDYVFAYLSTQIGTQIDLESPEGKAKMMAQIKQLTALLPKGSSFRYLLNNDIYYRLTGRRNQNKAAKDALLDFKSPLQIHHYLQLCLFYQPELVDVVSLEQIWQASHIHAYRQTSHEISKLTDNNLPIPPLPTWEGFGSQRHGDDIKQDLALPNLIELIELRLSQSDSKVLFASPNHAFHHLLASLPPALYADIIPHWANFYRSFSQQTVSDLSLLFQELLCQQLDAIFEQQMQSYQSIYARELINKQRQLLKGWLLTLQRSFN